MAAVSPPRRRQSSCHCGEVGVGVSRRCRFSTWRRLAMPLPMRIAAAMPREQWRIALRPPRAAVSPCPGARAPVLSQDGLWVQWRPDVSRGVDVGDVVAFFAFFVREPVRHVAIRMTTQCGRQRRCVTASCDRAVQRAWDRSLCRTRTDGVNATMSTCVQFCFGSPVGGLGARRLVMSESVRYLVSQYEYIGDALIILIFGA